jgi:predicted kinase
MRRPILYIFGGLPGTGKTALARSLAGDRRAVYLRIDTIEQALRETGLPIVGPEGYVAAYGVAADNLRLGRDVVADSVNPLGITRQAWREIADRCNATFVEIEVICSNAAEHRNRVETRSTDVPGLQLPTWAQVLNREYEPWDRPQISIDTSGLTVEQSFTALQRSLATDKATSARKPEPPAR